MFEARLTQGILMRKVLDSIKDLVQVSLTWRRKQVTQLTTRSSVTIMNMLHLYLPSACPSRTDCLMPAGC